MQKHNATIAIAALPLLLFTILSLYLVGGVFFSSDDPGFIYQASQQPGAISRDLLFPVGRWLNAFLIEGIFSRVDALPDLAIVRTFTVMWLMAFAAGLVSLLLRLGIGLSGALVITFIGLLTPSTGTILVWAQHVTVAFGAVLMLLAGHVLVNTDSDHRQKMILKVITATLLGFLAASINQSLLGFWGLIGAVFALSAATSAVLKQRLSLLAVSVVGSYGLAFLAVKLVANRGDRSSLTLDPIGKLEWFFNEPLLNSSYLFFLKGNRLLSIDGLLPFSMGYVFLALISFCAVAVTLKSEGYGKRIAALLIAVFLAYAPNLLASESWSSYRSTWALSTLLSSVAALAVYQLTRPLNRGRFGLAIAVVLSFFALAIWGQIMQEHFREPLIREAQFARDQAKLFFSTHQSPKPITVAIPHWTDNRPGLGRYDDVGTPQVRDWTAPFLVALLAKSLGYPQISAADVTVVDFEAREALVKSGGIDINFSGYAK